MYNTLAPLEKDNANFDTLAPLPMTRVAPRLKIVKSGRPRLHHESFKTKTPLKISRPSSLPRG